MFEAVSICGLIALGAFWVLAIGAELWAVFKTRKELKGLDDAD